MVTNNMLLKLKNRDSETISKTRDVLLRMKGEIEYLRDISVFVNIRPAGGSAYDLAVIAKYDSLQDFDAYLKHPVHLDVSKYIGTVVDSVAAVMHES